MGALEFEIWLGSVFVGRLIQGSDYIARFAFDDEYLHRARRPVLGQWFEDRLGADGFAGRFGRLPAYFDNLLPSQQLQRLIRLQHHLDEPSDAELLACVGEDLPGAIVVRDPSRSEPIGFSDSPAIEDENEEDQLRLHFSLAGLQLKFSLVKDGRLLTLPAKSRVGRVIAKIPTIHGLPGLVSNEYAVMQWARGAGFDVPACEIRDAGDLEGVPARVHGRKIFVIDRFDREAGRRVHQEDLAQIFGVASDDAVSSSVPFGYGDVCRAVAAILGGEGAREFTRRLALMVASGNEDAHLKNWALLYPDGVAPVWAPLYDQVATVAWSRGSQGPTLDIAGVRTWERLDKAALASFGAIAGMRGGEVWDLFDATIEQLRDAWSACGLATLLEAAHLEALVEHWKRVPILARHGPLPDGT